jgi:hypothetical protein
MWMDEVSEWIAGLATPGNMLYFILGFFTSPVLYWGWCMTKHRKFYVNWRYLGIALGITVMLFISIQTQVAYNIAAQTAQDTKACQAEFQAAIRGSREVTTQNDELSAKRRCGCVSWTRRTPSPNWRHPTHSDSPMGCRWFANTPPRQAKSTLRCA